MPKTKAKQGGRPQKQAKVEEIEILDEDILCINQFAFEMIQIIAILSNYKILTITGPKGTKNTSQKIQRRKDVEKIQEQIRATLGVKLDYVFFLKDFDNIVTSYKLENNKIVVEFQEEELDEVTQWLDDQKNVNNSNSDFYDSIQLLFKQLNCETQFMLKIIIENYAASDKNYSSFEEKFFNYLEQHTKQFSDLLKWDQLYEAAYNEKKVISEEELNEFQTKFSKNNTESKKEQKESKVERKRQEVINSELGSIQRMQEIKGPNRPIKYLLSQIFDKIAQNFRYGVEID